MLHAVEPGVPGSSALVWLRRDVRLHDHAALALATAHSQRVAVCFVFDTNILRALQDRDDRRVQFLLDSLAEVDSELRRSGSRLLVAHGDPVVEIPRIATMLGVERVVTNRDWEPYAIERDRKVAHALTSLAIDFVLSKDHLVLAPEEILSGGGTPFRVFTPYSKAWLAACTSGDIAERPVHQNRWWPADRLDVPGTELRSFEDIGFRPPTVPVLAGAAHARVTLDRFLRKIDDYADRRDEPAAEATSGLSIHLRHGTISVRECFRASMERSSAGARSWTRELIWREFYQMILGQFPHVVDRCFRHEFDSVRWEENLELFHAWTEGQTGYPIVDAAMRCFKATGWIHNRLRMITASFLTKDLLLDWRLGEAYFARLLLDFDLAQNNGGWQWCAGTGADAQPYFRIFNPTLQSRKFDPKGEFIRAWVPELQGLSDQQIHEPANLSSFDLLAAGAQRYPRPIVDHGAQRKRAIQMLSRATS